MKRLIFLLLLASPAEAAFVQSTGKQCSSNVPAQSYSFLSPPAVNNYVFVLVSHYPGTGDGGTLAVTDNQSNSYTNVVEQASGSPAQVYASIHFAKVTTSSGTFTVTLTMAGSPAGNYYCSVAMEWGGLTLFTLDRKRATAGAGVTSESAGPTAATRIANELVLAAIYPSGGGTNVGVSSPASTGYTSLAVEQNNSANVAFEASYKTVSATGTQVANWTTGVTLTTYAAVIATFAIDQVPPPSTITAATCNAADVQAALDTASAGDTAQIPSGSCTWTVQVQWNAPPNVRILGAGSLTTTGGGDVTVITDNLNRTTLGDIPGLQIVTNASGTFRLAGLTFTNTGGTNNTTYTGLVRFSGSSHNFRMDHVHLNNISTIQSLVSGWVYGVIDHIIVDATSGGVQNAIKIENGNGFGDQTWNAPTDLGTGNYIVVEDSVFTNGAGNDCSFGGRYTFRFNVFHMSAPAPTLQTHGLTPARFRTCRAWEIYANQYFANASENIAAANFMTGGTGVIWGNYAPGGTQGYRFFIQATTNRSDNSTYTEAATPDGWGYCGTGFNGTGSNWDGSNATSDGYPCMDLIGRGQGDLLTGDFPNVTNSTRGCTSAMACANPRQALEPVYEWLNNWTVGPTPGGKWGNYNGPQQAARDYYLDTGTTSVTGGVGTGTLANRPSNCTTGEAYWATDQGSWNAGSNSFYTGQGRLYKCTAANTWTLFYTPYSYPHPLINLTTAAGGVGAHHVRGR